jgi:hypothetical protein
MKASQKGNNEQKRETRAKKKTSLTKAAIWAFLSIGSVTLLTSIIYISSILAFIGLGLVFWGALLLYVQPEEYTKKALLDATLLPSLSTLNQIINELNYKGKAIYLPPKYSNDPEENKLYIPKQKEGEFPTPEDILEQENQIFLNKPQGILLTPPGAQLAKLFEKILETNFAKKDLQYITQNMPKLFVEDLEIADNLEIEARNDEIKITITNSAFQEAQKENNTLSHLCSSIGCPLSSAIACALTKATGKPITIEKIQTSEEGKNIEAIYRILGKIESETYLPKTEIEEQTKDLLTEGIKPYLTPLLPSLASLLLVSLGLIILVWVNWLTWYDITMWNKDIISIFFGSRTGHPNSLGIGMRVVHYFLIGLALLLSGLFTYFRRKETRLLIKEAVKSYLIPLIPNLASLLLAAIGLILVIQVVWITFYDVIIWGKDLTQIFLGSRIGEPISLGIGMKIIYYFLIGVALLLSGLLVFLRKRSRM